MGHIPLSLFSKGLSGVGHTDSHHMAGSEGYQFAAGRQRQPLLRTVGVTGAGLQDIIFLGHLSSIAVSKLGTCLDHTKLWGASIYMYICKLP